MCGFTHPELTSVAQWGSEGIVLEAGPTYCLDQLRETGRQAEGKNLMCCFLPVHSWHSSLPFSFFDCDFFSPLL